MDVIILIRFSVEVKDDKDMFIKNKKKRLEILAKENEDQHQKLLKSEGLIEELEGALNNTMKWKTFWRNLFFVALSVLIYNLLM